MNTQDTEKNLLAHIATLDNDQLFDAMIDAQAPDGWDGMFTYWGQIEAAVYLKAVKDRLRAIGWLTGD